MGISIRQADPSDAQDACALLRLAIEEGCAAAHGGSQAILHAWLGNKTPENVQSWFASSTNHAVLAERDGVLGGLALLNQAGKLALCYVHPRHTRCGIGSALLTAVEAQARLWNISKIYLHSPATASAFFARHGYANDGKDRACFGLECDFLWKQLDTVAAPPPKRFCNCGQ